MAVRRKMAGLFVHCAYTQRTTRIRPLYDLPPMVGEM